MILIANEIIETLENSTFTIPVSSVKEFYDINKIECPQIAINELPSNDGVYLDNQPLVVQNVFTVEIYAKQMIVSGTPYNKRKAAIIIALEVDKILNETYGLTMQGPIQAAPYEDETIFRAVMNYMAYIDTRTDKIYRSL